MKTKVVAGIDAGSTAIKVALYDGDRFGCWIRPAGWSPREESGALLKQAAREWCSEIGDIQAIIGTGYGRTSLAFVSKAMTEITCHARGAVHLTHGPATVIDIGGQDSKVIRTDGVGRVADFLMNDKCAAECGHCYAVCPQNAVTVQGRAGEETLPRQAGIAAEAMLDLLLNRRSSRLFEPVPVSDEHLQLLIQAASTAPSATNARQVKAYVVRNTALIDQIRESTRNYYSSLRKMFTLPGASLLARIQGISRDRIERVLPAILAITSPPEGKDPLFYNARTLIVFTVPKGAGEETAGDAWIAAQNLVIAAETIPVGTCYNGFLPYAAREFPYLKTLLDIPENEVMINSLLLGYSSGEYLRRPHRQLMPTVWK